MAHTILSLLVLFLAIFSLNTTVECHSRARARAYVEQQCHSTMYTELCIRTLVPFASKTNAPAPEQLARISLTTCLVKARITKAYVNMVAKEYFNKTKNARYHEAVTDCLRQINDGVNQITQSVKEQQRMVRDGEKDFLWHESNVQSWVSTALTDVTACLDRISDKAIGGKEKGMIKARVLNVKHLASNALALFNRFTTRHRGSRVIKTP